MPRPINYMMSSIANIIKCEDADGSLSLMLHDFTKLGFASI